MMRNVWVVGVRAAVLGLSLVTAACGGGDESAPAPQQTATPGAPATGTGSEGLSIEFRSQPDPPQSGGNTIEVTVNQADGAPVTDAAVTAVFSMPAMPSMNMPAMRSDAPLTHAGNGVYRGTGELSMAGTWNVAITVSRGADQLGTRRLSIIAK